MIVSLTMLVEDWWEAHPFRVSTVSQTGFTAVYVAVLELLRDLPNEENQ